MSKAIGSAHLGELDVRNLVDEYCYHVMTADTQAWAETWAPEAVWSVPGQGKIETRLEICRTFDAIRSTYAFCVQELLGVRIELAPDHQTARTRCLVRELQWSQDEVAVGSELIGVYDDEIIATSDGAQFQARDFALLYSGPVSLNGRFHRAAYERSKHLRRPGE